MMNPVQSRLCPVCLSRYLYYIPIPADLNSGPLGHILIQMKEQTKIKFVVSLHITYKNVKRKAFCCSVSTC